MAQETFLTAYNKLSSFDGTNFKAWITCIAANKCRDFLRQLRETRDIDAENIADVRNSPELIAEQKDGEECTKRLINLLDEPYRTVCEKYFIEDIKLSDYARATNQNLKTLQTRLYRAKKMLKNLWREENCNAYIGK